MATIRKFTNRFTESEVDDEIVIMRLDTGNLYSLPGTAAAAWRLIDGTRDRAALISALAGEFAADEQEVAADLDELLTQLRQQGLLEQG